jgi:hypothetical protein
MIQIRERDDLMTEASSFSNVCSLGIAAQRARGVETERNDLTIFHFRLLRRFKRPRLGLSSTAVVSDAGLRLSPKPLQALFAFKAKVSKKNYLLSMRKAMR